MRTKVGMKKSSAPNSRDSEVLIELCGRVKPFNGGLMLSDGGIDKTHVEKDFGRLCDRLDGCFFLVRHLSQERGEGRKHGQ